MAATRIKVNDVDVIWVEEGSGGPPIPAAPTYHADLATNGAGVILWRQHEQQNFKVAASGGPFALAFPESFALRPFQVEVNALVTDGGEAVLLDVTGVTAAGLTLTPSRVFTGSVNVDAFEIIP